MLISLTVMSALPGLGGIAGRPDGGAAFLSMRAQIPVRGRERLVGDVADHAEERGGRLDVERDRGGARERAVGRRQVGGGHGERERQRDHHRGDRLRERLAALAAAQRVCGGGLEGGAEAGGGLPPLPPPPPPPRPPPPPSPPRT